MNRLKIRIRLIYWPLQYEYDIRIYWKYSSFIVMHMARRETNNITGLFYRRCNNKLMYKSLSSNYRRVWRKKSKPKITYLAIEIFRTKWDFLKMSKQRLVGMHRRKELSHYDHNNWETKRILRFICISGLTNSTVLVRSYSLQTNIDR